ncbi:MAG: aspartate kinase, partial [Eubacteriales bacterium]
PKDTIITGVAGHKGYSSITVEKDRMNTEVGFGRKILQVLEEFGVSFEHTPTGIDTMSIVVTTASIEGIRDDIIAQIFKDASADSVTIEDGMALIAIVGRGMVRNKGTSAKLFTAIANADINIRMIDQGSGENNIIVGVGDDDYVSALKTIYNAFVKN